MVNNQGNIGVIDSGVGGLSVLRHIQKVLPAENIIYVADQAHVPYGPRPVNTVRLFCQGISSFLIEQRAKIIVVACNTASAGALDYLRSTFPAISFVGMEPAIKPGAHETRTGKIGVLATPGTFDSVRYARLMAQFAGDIQVYEDPCRGLVELIEGGQFDGRSVKKILEGAINPMIRAGVDTLVLGCTHYPFVLPLIHEIAGPDVGVIDPAPAVALQVERVLATMGLLAPWEKTGHIQTFTTGENEFFTHVIKQLLGRWLPVANAFWSDDYQLNY
jgi:glutamate racemase